MSLSTRELLYLEDVAKLFESVDKNCHTGMQMSNDSQLKSLLQSISQDHHHWISSISSLVNSNGTLQ